MIIEKKNEDQFFSGFDKLRKKYADYFSGIQDLPVIHMRQIWGKNPPYDKGKNPFSSVDFETRFLWSREVLSYLVDTKRNGLFSYMSGTFDVVESQKVDAEFFQSEMMQNEQNIIRERFRNCTKEFYQIVLNPLPFTIARTMTHVDLVVRNLNGTVEFIYDQSEGSKGFDVLTSYQIAKNTGFLKNISKVIPSTTRQHIGLQCADVIAYIEQRKNYANYMSEVDEGLNRLTSNIRVPFISFNNNAKDRIEFREARHIAMMLHYELAVQTLREQRPYMGRREYV